MTDAITSANAVDVAKEIERSCHPHLRRLDKFLFCDPAFADKYNDAYLLTHAGISYNTKYNQSFIEGSNNKTTLVPQDNGQGATGTTSTTIAVEATDEVPSPFYYGIIETEDGDIAAGNEENTPSGGSGSDGEAPMA